MARVFVSYAHEDQGVARRLSRRLHAYGIETWLDERDLRLGSALGPQLESHLRACDFVVVVATAAAARSRWVERELGFALRLEPPRSVCPFFLEHVEEERLFSEHAGVDATDPHHFEEKVRRVAEEIAGAPLPPPARDVVAADLERLAAEEPALRVAVEACQRDGSDLMFSHVEALARASFHGLDGALTSLYDLATGERRNQMASQAGTFFRKCGVGTWVLKQHLATVTDHGSDGVLMTALGTEPLQATELDAALALLAAVRAKQDLVLARFARMNRPLLNPAQRDAVVQLVTHPHRAPAAQGTAEAAFEALVLVPGSRDLRFLWQHWVSGGEFDRNPREIVEWIARARAEGVLWEGLVDDLVGHVRRHLRSAERGRVERGILYLTETDWDPDPGLRSALSIECANAPGSYEWKDWGDAKEMGFLVWAYAQAAATRGDGSATEWLLAHRDYEERWARWQAFEKLQNSRRKG